MNEVQNRRRQIEWGKVVTWLVFLTIIVGGAWGFIYSHMKERHTTETRQQQTDAFIAALVLKYNAVTNWEASLPDRGAGALPFSIDVSRALMESAEQYLDSNESTPRSVLVIGSVDDVFEKDGKIFVSLLTTDTRGDALLFELQCTSDQWKIFNATNQFAVVARCHEVQRVMSDNEDFLVKGELLDAVQLPQDATDHAGENQAAPDTGDYQ